MITIFKTFTDVAKPYYITIDRAIDRIRNGASRTIIEMIRSNPDEDTREALKKKLPCVLFSGEFSRRNSSSLVAHSGYIVLDFDDIGYNCQEYRDHLKDYPFIYSAWVSPSGKGVKALVKISNPDMHREHFASLKEVFPNLDRSGVNVDRICYESWDSDIWVNKESEVYDQVIDEKGSYEPVDIPETDEEKIYAKLKKWIENRGELFVEGNRNYFVMRMAAAMNRTGISEGSCINFLLFDFVKNDSTFTLNELKSTVSKVYRNYRSQFGTMQFEKRDIVEASTGEVMNEEAFDASIEIDDLIYFSDVVDNLRSIRDNGTVKGETTYFPVLDNHFRWSKSEVTVLHGYGNIGKSTFGTHLNLIKTVREGVKWVYFSPESYPTEYFYKSIMQQYLGKSIDRTSDNAMSDIEFEEAYQFVNDHFFVIYPENENPTPDLILKRFAEVIFKHKVAGVVIDPFNQLDNDWGKNGRDDRYLDKTLAKFKRFAQNYLEYFMIMAHPSKPLKTKDGSYPTPSYYDLAGGAMWANKTDNILCYHRPRFFTDPADNLVEVSSQKIKKQDVNGILGTVEFEYSRKRFRFFERGYSPLESRSKEVEAFVESKFKINPNDRIEPARESDDEPF
jgi:hypothetical protein